MNWQELPARLDELYSQLTEPTTAVKRAVADVFTDTPVGYFYCPANQKIAIHGRVGRADFARCKSAAARALGANSVRHNLLDDTRASTGEWIKVAYSPSIRRTGEALNFFPGTYPGGIPNHPSPMAAMLASALVGGGLGYGLGWLGEKVLPEGYGKKLKRTGAIVGAAAGALPGAAWAIGNHATNHSITDSWPFTESTKPSDSPTDDRPDIFSTHIPNADPPVQKFQMRGIRPQEQWPASSDPSQFYPDLSQVKLGKDFTKIAAGFLKKANFGDFGGDFVQPKTPTPYDVHINHLGQTLWETGASAPLMGATMGTMYAAQKLPDPNARPGWATGNQLGQLAMNAGNDYLTGLALGALVNVAVGTPYSAPTYGAGNAALGLIRAGVQSLFSGE